MGLDGFFYWASPKNTIGGVQVRLIMLTSTISFLGPVKGRPPSLELARGFTRDFSLTTWLAARGCQILNSECLGLELIYFGTWATRVKEYISYLVGWLVRKMGLHSQQPNTTHDNQSSYLPLKMVPIVCCHLRLWSWVRFYFFKHSI